MQVAIVAGGVGGSRFVRGVRAAFPQAHLEVIVNTADDITMHGLRICPDLDTMMYALAGAIDAQRGWGRSDETWRVGEELAAYGVEPSWFGLGDLDLATHLVRSQMLEAGYPLSEVTEALCSRWLAKLPDVRLRPMSDDRVETHVVVADPAAASGRATMHFQEYWVRHRAVPEALQVMQVGIERARPAPGVLAAFESADLILIAPSNPVVSIGPVAAVPGVRAAIAAAAAPVIGFSPIIGGAPVLGMAHRLLPVIGVETDAAAVGLHYGARSAGGLLDAWVMHSSDSDEIGSVQAAGIACGSTDLIMRDPEATAGFVRFGVELARP